MPKNLGTAQEVSSSADPVLEVTRRFPPPWSVEDLGEVGPLQTGR
jgi:hypothetical protein